MTYSNSWTESCISSVADTGISFQGLWRQQNLSWTWSNREPQTMPIIIAVFYPAVTFIHHPQPEESCKISPFSERLMMTLAPSFCASAYSFLPCENQPRSFSLLQSTFSSAAAAVRQKVLSCLSGPQWNGEMSATYNSQDAPCDH